MACGLPVVRVFLRGIPTFLAKNMNQMHLNKGLVAQVRMVLGHTILAMPQKQILITMGIYQKLW